MNLLDEQLFAALAISAQRRLSEFNVQGLANTAWAFATVNLLDKKLFAALAREAERRVSEFNAQDLANTAWAFATMNRSDEKVFTAVATATERRLGEFNALGLANAAWEFRMLGEQELAILDHISVLDACDVQDELQQMYYLMSIQSLVVTGQIVASFAVLAKMSYPDRSC